MANKIIEKYEMIKFIFENVRHYVLVKEYFKSWKWEFYHNDEDYIIFLTELTWNKFKKMIDFERFDFEHTQALKKESKDIELSILAHESHDETENYIYWIILENQGEE